MKELKNLVLRYASLLAAAALAIGVETSSSASWLFFNQPVEPEGVEKFVKDK